MLYPLQFKPIFQERIWGGRSLENLYRKDLPPAVPIGESWEISDRPEAQSILLNGPLAGKSLHWLMENHARELMSDAAALQGRFPLLVKILDARDKLSLQVHPPAAQAAALGGEPKTELWFITQAEPGASLYVGLRQGVTRAEFERKIADGSVADCFHRIDVAEGDSMFLPSGRVHAIGAGLVIFEIQQNSDTTYRVFDWNRRDAHGQPRALHLQESLACIDFSDFEPTITPSENPVSDTSAIHLQTLADDPLFKVEAVTATPGAHLDYSLRAPRVLGVVSGAVRVLHPEHPLTLQPGQFCLLPAVMHRVKLQFETAARFLVAQPGAEK